jgi:hypothetical protein
MSFRNLILGRGLGEFGALALVTCMLLAGRPVTGAESFEFVVIGDTRPRFESEDFRIFEGLLQKINEAKPALVINLGDLIYGYGMRKEKQWDLYQQVVRRCEVPYYQVPGNHDTFSREARRVYGQRFGKFYQSSDYGGCHFVLLDTCESTRWGYLGPKEMEWLKADLQTNQLRPVFVFTHFPVWEAERIKPQYHDFWTETLHPLFREFGVKAVFGGHYHCYGPTREIDGIRYFVTGGGGAELLPDYRKSGGEHHFVKVRVTGEDFDLRVVTSRGELTDLEADIMGGFLFGDRHTSRVGVGKGAGDLREGIRGAIVLENPYKEWLTGTARWQVDPSSFQMRPQTMEVRIPPGGGTRLQFELKALKPAASLHSLPRLEFQVRAGGREHRFHRELVLTDTLRTPLLPEPVTLDGRLGEWRLAPSLEVGISVATKTEVRAFHDRDRLYLAVTGPKLEPAAEEEEEAFPDDLLLGIAARLSGTEFGRDIIRLGFTRNGSQTEVRDRTPGQKLGATVPGVRAASRESFGRVTFETSIPLKLLAPLKAAGKTHLVLSLSTPAPRQESESNEQVNPSRNSFAYQVRYGGDALIPVHFIELILEGKP